jgi:hypothetical protein
MSQKPSRNAGRTEKDFADKVTFRPPRPRWRKWTLSEEADVVADEDRLGRFSRTINSRGHSPYS